MAPEEPKVSEQPVDTISTAADGPDNGEQGSPVVTTADTPASDDASPFTAAEEEDEEPAELEAEVEDVNQALFCATTLAHEGDPDEAAAVLRNECSKASASEQASVRQDILEAYLQQDRVDLAVKHLLELLQPANASAGSAPPAILPASQELVLRALVQAQQLPKAAELLKCICSSGATPPGDTVFNGVVDAAVRARAYGEAWDVLELLLLHKRRADKYFVSILTKSLESSNDRRWVRRGINLVDRFIEQQREDVDEIVFNSLLNVLGHDGNMVKLQQTLSKMNEYGVPPSAVTYGTVVKAYGRARDIDAVLKVWNDMRGRNLAVNPVTCGCVLDACVKCGHLDKAMLIFQEMRLNHMHKNTVLYATLFKGLAKVRDLQQACHLYQDMRMEGVPCNLVTFNSLMDVCVRCGDLQTAAYFLQDMMQMGIEPDLITFSTLIKGYAHTGEVHKALALSKELKQRGLKCDEIMYNSLIDGCAKANKVNEGLAVFDDMLQSRVNPSNITFSILVKLHFEAGQIDIAFRLVDDMANKYRCAPSRIVYTVLLRCCAQHGGAALARGAALLGELAGKRNSKMPDQGMVGAVISGCAQHNDFETAIRIVRDFTASGARRGTATVPIDCLKNLFEALGSHDEERGKELLEYLRRKSLSAAHISQLQAALADGRRRPATTAAGSGLQTAATTAEQASSSYSSPAGGLGFTGMPTAGGSMRPMGATPPPMVPAPALGAMPNAYDPYCQWHQAQAYPPPPQAFMQPDIYQGYPAAYPQQLGYYGGYPSMPFVGGVVPNVASLGMPMPLGMPSDEILQDNEASPFAGSPAFATPPLGAMQAPCLPPPPTVPYPPQGLLQPALGRQAQPAIGVLAVAAAGGPAPTTAPPPAGTLSQRFGAAEKDSYTAIRPKENQNANIMQNQRSEKKLGKRSQQRENEHRSANNPGQQAARMGA